MKPPQILPVILSGGVGSRLWPLSRKYRPKPFIKLDDGDSLIQKAYRRALSLSTTDEIVTVTNRDLFFQTRDEYSEIGVKSNLDTFLLEPVGRNSTAAIGVAAHYAAERYGESCALLIMPADHLIEDVNAFKLAVDQAVSLAASKKIVTFGIQPTAPETGFGYIEALGTDVVKFVEKPDAVTAQAYLSSGNFYWNSGMFCFRAGGFLGELSKFCPEIAKQTLICLSGAKYSQGETWHQYEMSYPDFEQIQDVSFDYAILEKSDDVAVIPCDIGWSDIGSWTEFGSLHPEDEHGNHIKGKVLLKETSNCVLYGADKLLATIGLDDLIIADTSDAILIAHKDRVQDVRKIVNELEHRDDPSYKQFPEA